MLARNTILAIGILILGLGAIVAALWIRAANVVVAAPGAAPPVSILVAAREIPVGTLLRTEDLIWNDVASSSVSPDEFARGSAAQADFVGAVTRVTLEFRQPLTATDFIKPGDRDFLVATLAPGDRAVSIPVDEVQSESGLMLPGDRVDVVLTQNFAKTGDPGHRSVGETVLHDLRIIAVDQTLASTPVNTDDKATAAGGEPKMPKTITLEVLEQQAQKLLVADQLGKLQFTLRGRRSTFGESVSAQPIAPTWASDVSPALEGAGMTVPVNKGVPLAIEVIHGSKIERRCVSGNWLVAC
jgi:pilus assembly protein CpaB